MSLPIVSSKSKIRTSKSARWRAGVLIAVHAIIALHIAHWLTAGTTITPVEPSEAMAFSKAGMVNAGLIFFVLAIISTVIFGRFFCGWACHLVALQDLARWLLGKLGIRPQPLRSRWLAWIPMIAFCYMFLWPVAYRLWIGDDFSHVGFELTTNEFWATFPGWIIGGLTFLLCGFVIIYFLGAKGFCTYACPYGAIFGVAEKLSPMRIRVTDACAGCGHCTAVCTSNVRVHQEVRDFGMVVDSGCMKCLDCVSVCPNDALYYGKGPIPLLAKPRTDDVKPKLRPLSWQDEATLAIAFAIAFLSFRGLYGAVPFLMSLGLAGILAYNVLILKRMAMRDNVTLRRIHLKRQGKLQRGGFVYGAMMVTVLAFWGHSAMVRYHTTVGERAYRQTVTLRNAALDVTAEPPAPSSSDNDKVARALHHLTRASQIGLFEPIGLAGRLAFLHLLTGSLDEAVGQARQALSQGEPGALMHRLLGRVAAAQGDVDGAVAAYESALVIEPRNAHLHVGLGITLAQARRFADAQKVFTRGLEAVQTSPTLFYNAGLVRAIQGDNTAAVPFFEQALVLNPAYLEARENLAGLLASLGRFEDSVFHYRTALEQAPEDSRTRFLLARALLASGFVAEASLELQECLRLEPGFREAAALLEEITRVSSSGPGGGGR